MCCTSLSWSGFFSLLCSLWHLAHWPHPSKICVNNGKWVCTRGGSILIQSQGVRHCKQDIKKWMEPLPWAAGTQITIRQTDISRKASWRNQQMSLGESRELQLVSGCTVVTVLNHTGVVERQEWPSARIWTYHCIPWPSLFLWVGWEWLFIVNEVVNQDACVALSPKYLQVFVLWLERKKHSPRVSLSSLMLYTHVLTKLFPLNKLFWHFFVLLLIHLINAAEVSAAHG